MANIDQVHANSMLVFSLSAAATGGSAVTTTAPLHLRLMVINGTATANGTELGTGGGYVQGTGITPVAFSVPAAGATANTGALTQANMPATTIVGGELWDSSGSPHRTWFGALSSSKIVNSGDTFTVPIGALQIGLG